MKKTQEPGLVTFAALNCFAMNCEDVKNPLARRGGIVHPRVTQSRSMDMSMGSITAENTRKTCVYLNYKYFKLFRCVRTSCIHVRSPQSTAYEFIVDKYFVPCVRIVTPVHEIRPRATVVASVFMCHV